MGLGKCENDTRKQLEIILRNDGINFSCRVSYREGLPPPASGSGSFYGVRTCPKGWKPGLCSRLRIYPEMIFSQRYQNSLSFFVPFFFSFVSFLFVCFLSRFLSLFELNVTARCHSEPGLFIVESSGTSTFKVSSAELKAQLFWSGNGKGLF